MSTVGGLQSKERNLFPFEGCFNIFNSRGIVNVVSCIPDDDEQILGIFIIEIGSLDALNQALVKGFCPSWRLRKTLDTLDLF